VGTLGSEKPSVPETYMKKTGKSCEMSRKDEFTEGLILYHRSDANKRRGDPDSFYRDVQKNVFERNRA